MTARETSFDTVVIGAGAAGLFHGALAGQRGRRVLVIDHAAKPAEKVRISGGGRCNFTNIHTRPERFLSQNPRGHVLMYMEMGSGKSAALGACIRARNLDAVIVVPAIVVSGMCLELEAWLGFRLEGGAPPRSVKRAPAHGVGPACLRVRHAHVK